jgi:DNA/RNA endonuclease YhcR with UshA esterase domain
MKNCSLLFIVLIAAAVLVTLSCKEEDVFNIVGAWNALLTWIGPEPITGP